MFQKACFIQREMHSASVLVCNTQCKQCKRKSGQAKFSLKSQPTTAMDFHPEAWSLDAVTTNSQMSKFPLLKNGKSTQRDHIIMVYIPLHKGE